MSDVLMRAENLKVHFPITGGILRHTVGHVRAVDGIAVPRGARD
jgi:oligopeptide transport system ATP-binding protein